MSENTLILWSPPALAAAGAGLSLWIARQSAGGRGLPGCGAGSGCDAVTRSRWSKWLGVPVAAPAAVLYVLLAGGCLTVIAGPAGAVRHIARLFLLAAAPLLAAAGVWFVGLQALLLRRFCTYCLLLHGIVTAVAAAIALGLPGGGFEFAYSGMPGGELIAVLSVAGAGAAALVLGQVLVRPKTFIVGTVASGQWPVVSCRGTSVVSGQSSVVSGGAVTQSSESDKPAAQRSGAPDASDAVATSQDDHSRAVLIEGSGDVVEISPAPGTPGEGWGGGSVVNALREAPSLTRPRSTGGGDKSDAGSAATRAPNLPGSTTMHSRLDPSCSLGVAHE